MEKSEILERYGNIPLKFSGYYKYTFSFKGEGPDGESIYMSIGGSADDIYRFELTPETTFTLSDDNYSYAAIRKNGEDIWTDSGGW